MFKFVLTWYLALQFLSLVGLPLTFAWLRRLPSRGYAAAKALGVLLTGVIFWWGSLMHLWGNTSAAVIVAAGALLGVGLWAMRGHWSEVADWWRVNRGFVLLTEAIFLGALLLWAAVRAAQPQLETAGGEKWMEIALLNAVLRSANFPPHDPWLSGYAISYYYLGYLLLGMVTRLTALPATIAFNLGNAGWFALAAVGAYGIVYDLLEKRDALRPIFAPLMLLLVGNAEGLLEVFHARGLLGARFWAWLGIGKLQTPPEAPFSWIPQRFFWWWQASRVIQDSTPWGDHQEVIDEFPAFSFTLGDMHPHVLALPFVLLMIVLALNLYRRRDDFSRERSWRAGVRRMVPLIGYAAVLGTLGFLNTWDYPIYWALTVGALTLARQVYLAALTPADADFVGAEEEEPRGAAPPTFTWPLLFEALWDVLPEAVFLGVLGIVFYFPFWWALRSQAGGVLPNLFNPTRWPHFLIMFFPLLLPVVGVLVGAARESRARVTDMILWAVSLIVGIALVALLLGAPVAWPYLQAILRGEAVQGISMTPDMVKHALFARLTNPWVGLLLALGTGAAVLALLGRDLRQPLPMKVGFPTLLVLIGLLLALAPEFVYLKDLFMTRMNTIFKFYFQVWVLWSLAGAWQIARWIEELRAIRYRAGYLALVLLSFSGLLVGGVYTTLAVPARAGEHGRPGTLDGAAWLATAYPQDYAAIQWINANIEGAPVILETPGDKNGSYTYEGRVSALTGLPTVLGWSFHEQQWRGSFVEQSRRVQDLERLFTETDPQVMFELLDRYAVEYIYVGPLERARYPEAGLQKFATLFPAVYDQNEVSIYRVNP